jgi:hypothetical protein
VPAALARLVLEMLSKTTTGRPATALEVAARLERILVTVLAEGEMTVADYMDRHFATARDRHRAVLTEQLRRGEAALAGAASARPQSTDLILKTRERRAGPPQRTSWRPIAVAAGAVGLMAFAGVRLTRPPPAAAAVPAAVAVSAPPSGVEIVPLPPPLSPPIAEGPPPPPAAESPPPPVAATSRPATSKRNPGPRHDRRRGARFNNRRK